MYKETYNVNRKPSLKLLRSYIIHISVNNIQTKLNARNQCNSVMLAIC